MRIPKIIHQTWKTEHIPKKFQAYVRSWQTYHPDWDYVLWTNRACRNLIQTHYPWFLEQYDAYLHTIQRVDAFRYFLMHQLGGVYVDLDFECLRAIEPILKEYTCVLGAEPEQHARRLYAQEMLVCNAFIASTPQHRFWDTVFTTLRQEAHQEEPVQSTGPLMLHKAYEAYPDQDVTVYPSQVFYPLVDVYNEHLGFSGDEKAYYLDMKRDRTYPQEAYAVHHWAAMWYHKNRLKTHLQYMLRRYLYWSQKNQM